MSVHRTRTSTAARSVAGVLDDDTLPVLDSTASNVKRVVVGLDFGTYGTGISYKTLNNNDEINYCSRWPGRAEPPYCKALTAILYKGSEPVAWGWEAHRQYSELDEVQKHRGNYCYITEFKLGLDSSSRRSVENLPPGRTVKGVIADFLRLFTQHCVDNVLSDVYRTKLWTSNIQWCLTVPAIWKDDQKDAMRQAAHEAGMIPTHGSSNLRIILEPEAAALHAHDTKMLLGLQPGETFMMLDAGGGTVDLTVHTVQRKDGQLVLEETVPGDGGFCGSTYVDKDFEAWFRMKVGKPVFDRWKQQYCGEYLLLLTKWEEEKRLFKVSAKERKVPIILPTQLLNNMDDHVVLQLEEDDGYDDRLFISQKQMKAFFEPHLKQIVALAKSLAAACPGRRVDKVLLAGGFCKSPYLVACLKERLGGVVCPAQHIVAPPQPEAIILQGAALAYAGPAMITSRKLRLTYGIEYSKQADDSTPSDKRYWHAESKTLRVLVFSPIAIRGQSIKVDQVITEEGICGLHTAQESATVTLYTVPITTSDERVYMDQPGMKKVAKLTVPLVPGGEDRFNMSFMFGLEEIRMTAMNGKALSEPISVVASYCQNSF